MKAHHYEHGEKRCGRCKGKTRTLLHKVKAGRYVLMEVCSRCSAAILRGEPLYLEGKA